MDNDGPPFVDFKCSKCHAVLCRTDGRSIRLHIDGFLATVWIAQIELRCASCGTDRTWFSTEKYDRKRNTRFH